MAAQPMAWPVAAKAAVAAAPPNAGQRRSDLALFAAKAAATAVPAPRSAQVAEPAPSSSQSGMLVIAVSAVKGGP